MWFVREHQFGTRPTRSGFYVERDDGRISHVFLLLWIPVIGVRVVPLLDSDQVFRGRARRAFAVRLRLRDFRIQWCSFLEPNWARQFEIRSCNTRFNGPSRGGPQT